jgi:hypothetical protein
MAAPERYDDMFMMLASQHQGVLPLLRTFFSFLQRKTDFYIVDPSPQRRIGFEEGVAEKLVRAVHRRP